MALRRMLVQRLSSIKSSRPINTPQHSPIPPNAKSTSSMPESWISRRFFHRRIVEQAETFPDFGSPPERDQLKEALRLRGNRIGLDGLLFPATSPAPAADAPGGLSVADARKILRVAQLEKLKAKLRDVPKNAVSYSEFVEICAEGVSSRDQAVELAKTLDDAGNVVVLGDTVLLWPEQVARSMEGFISGLVLTVDDPRRTELEHMEKHKAAIDRKARAQVQGELYCGLGYVVAQTLGFMRLTFWELTWDVMEPICFFVASLHFAAGYAFFLRTSSEPTFRGYFQRRFRVKQKRLMVAQNFNVGRYHQLRRVCFRYHGGDHGASYGDLTGKLAGTAGGC